jgi:hypothetical protein
MDYSSPGTADSGEMIETTNWGRSIFFNIDFFTWNMQVIGDGMAIN